MTEEPKRPARIEKACKHLRTKSLYVADGRDASALVEPSDTAVYWCNKTGGALGPDSDLVGPRDCGDGRDCYRSMSVIVTTLRRD